jgi:hypothetical protein
MNVFIVGSPRSGTTLLGDILDLHPQIGRWYEPYFVLDYYFRQAPHDDRTAAEATPAVRQYLETAFDYYRRKRHCQIVVDKSPRNSLKIPFLCATFPQARFIHILRDGRDTTLSIHKEWQKRQKILRNNGNFLQAVHTVTEFVARQPLIVHKIAALRFELGDLKDILAGNPQFLHKVRWGGRIGWGPRFAGWQAVIDQVSTLEFNALQWARCVEAVLAANQYIEADRFMEIRYEALLRQPEETFKQIFDFLAVSFPPDFMKHLPPLSADNFGKWQTAFSSEEKARLGPLLQPLLSQLRYTADDSWYHQNIKEELCASERF